MGKKSKPKQPAAPDYGALATQQGQLNKEAAFDTTLANRANQYGPSGSKTWDIDPTTGQWSETVSMSPENQYMADLIRGGQMTALGNYADQAGKPIDTSGMAQWKNPELGDVSTEGLTNWGDPSKLQAGFGGVKEVQDAMMRMLQPGLDQRRNAEMTRLKAQGITEMSDPWNSSQQNLATGENEASDRALMSAVGAYGDVFNRQLQANQYSDTLRGKQFDERLGVRDQTFDEANFANKLRQAQYGEATDERGRPIEDFANLSQAMGTLNPTFGSYGGAAGADPADMLGAAQSKYSDDISRYNAEAASKSSGMGSILSTVGTIGGAIFGGPAGAAIGGALGGMLGGGGGGGGGMAAAAPPPGMLGGGSGGLKIPWATSVYS